MKKYVGVKLIDAVPMSLGEYNHKRGWTIPEDEDPSRDGYFIQYPDGYVSWSPKEVFEEAYREIEHMTFGLAVEMAKKGKKIARAGWNGKGMFVVVMPELKLPPYSTQAPGPKVNDRTAKHIGVDTPLESQSYFAMFTATKQWQPGWTASQADVMSEDWTVIE